MKNAVLILFYTTFCVAPSISGYFTSSEETDSSSSEEADYEILKDGIPDFDVLIFTQRWPITCCYEWKEQNKDHVCTLPSPKDIWTIHGIWPTKFNTLGPSFCNKTAKFNVKELAPIEKTLEQFWTNIEKNKPVDSLWEHEWLKHGTCAAEAILELSNENKYFGQGLSWLQQHSMASILTDGGIIPGKNYTVVQIHEELVQKLGKNVAIECFHDPHTKLQFLNEIRICFTKNLELTDCDGIRFQHEKVHYLTGTMLTNCNINKIVVYPALVPISSHEKRMRNDILGIHTYDREDREKGKKRLQFMVNVYKLIRLIKWATF